MESLGLLSYKYFNPRSLAGATLESAQIGLLGIYFNPRSLAGATERG